MPELGPEFMTTRELADLLRIGERKVYDLAASGEVPTMRAVGKLLFPRKEIEAWLASSRTGPQPSEELSPNIFVGSHDPLLEWALRQSGCGMPAHFDGSSDGLARMVAREAVLAGMHIPDEEGWNVASVRNVLSGAPVVLVEFARRMCGLIVPPGNPRGIVDLSDLEGIRFVRRQSGAGGQVHFEKMARAHGLDLAALAGPERPARTEDEVADFIRDGRADAAFGLAAVAARHGQAFVPLAEDRFDLLVQRRAFFEAPLQALFAFLRSEDFRERAAAMEGYSIAAAGTVHFNG